MTDSEKPETQRHRRLVFSLRTLMVFFVLLGGGVGWLGREVSIVRDEELAIASVRKIDDELQVYFDYQNRNPDDDVEFLKESPVPDLIKRLFGKRVFTRVDSLSFCMSAEDGEIDLNGMRSLKDLRVCRVGADGTSLRNLFDARNAPTLDQLKIPESVRTMNIHEFNLEGIERLHAVESLVIWNGRIKFQQLENLDFLPHNSDLQVLDLINCRELKSLDGIEKVPNIEELSFSGEFESLSQLQSMSRLKRLDIASCEFSSIESLRQLPRLLEFTLSLNGNNSVRSQVACLANQDSLESLTLYSARKLKSLDSLPQLEALESLAIYDCESLDDVQSLYSWNNLTQLVLTDCEMLKSIEGVPNLTGLADLSVTYGLLLENLEPLECAKRLQRLDLEGCASIKSLKGLNQLRDLTELVLVGCEGLETIEAILELPKLEHVNLVGCDQVPKGEIEKLKKICADVKTESERGWF